MSITTIYYWFFLSFFVLCQSQRDQHFGLVARTPRAKSDGLYEPEFNDYGSTAQFSKK